MENQIREFTKKGNRRRLFKRVVSLLCVVVLLFTMNTLKRNANTLERIAMCGLQEHTHTAGCYNSSGELVCAIPEHVHTDACYQQSPSDDLVLNGDDLEIADGLVDAGDTQSLDLSLDLDQGDLLDFVQDSDAPASNVQDIGNDMPVLDGDLVFDTSYNNEETQQLAANTSVEEAQGAIDETQSEEAQQLLEEEQIAVEDGQGQPTGEGQEQISFEEDQEQPVEQPTEAAQEQPVEEETEQPVEEETEQPVEEEQEQPVEEETEQLVEEETEQPVEEETEQPVEGEQLVEEDQDQIAIEEQPVVAEQEQPTEEVQEQLVIEEQEESVVEAQEEPVVEEQEEPVVEEQEEPVIEEQEEPVVEEQEEPVIEEQEEPVVEEQEEPVVEEQEEPVVEEQEEPAVEEQEEPVVEEQEEPVVEEQEEPVVEEQEEPAVEEQEEPVVEEQEEPAVEEQEEPAIEEQEEPAIEAAEQPTEEEAGQPAEEEAEQPAEEEAEQPAEEEAEQPAEEEAEQPAEEEAEQPTEEEAEQLAEENAEQAAEENAEQAAEEEAEQPAEEEAEQPTEEEAEQPAEEEAEQPAEEEAEQPAEEETEEPTIEEAEQPAEVESDPEAEGESEEEPEARIAYPAKQFRQGTAYINVSVDAPEGAFPEGTVMVVKDVEDQGTIDNIQQSVAEDFVEVTSVHAVDISFWYDDVEIEPLLPIAVVMSAVEAPNADHETVVVHVDDNGETQLVDSEATGAAEAALEMPAAADAEAQAFEADTFSVYALVTKQVIETKYIDDHGDTWRIKVDYGKDAKLPEGASLRVAEVTDETYLAEAEAALESGKRITKARFFDIKIMDGDREVQPDGQVKVTITLEGDEGEVEAAENQNDIGNPDVVAMHFVEQDDETVSVEKQSAVETDEGVVFNADGFSAWGVIYTVDFEVEGDQGEITLDFTAFDATTLPEEDEIYYDTEDCSIHVALGLLADIVNNEEEAGYDIDVNAALVDNYEFDFDKAEMGKSDSGMRFEDGELIIASDGFVELTEGERLLRVRATGLTALKQALLETEGVSIEVVSGNVPLGSEASYTAHTDEETAELVENYINNEENGDSEVAGYSAADLKIVRNDETLPVEGRFQVTVDKASLVPVGMKLDKLYHIHRNENDEAVVEELAFEETEAGLVFEVANFSDIVAGYTVDFTYVDEQGKEHFWQFPGTGSHKISEVLAELGIEAEAITAVDLVRTKTVGEFGEKDLYLSQDAESGEWYINSDAAFDDTYLLTVTADEKVYEITVTDAHYTPNVKVTVNGISELDIDNYDYKIFLSYSYSQKQIKITSGQSEYSESFDIWGENEPVIQIILAKVQKGADFDINNPYNAVEYYPGGSGTIDGKTISISEPMGNLQENGAEIDGTITATITIGPVGPVDYTASINFYEAWSKDPASDVNLASPVTLKATTADSAEYTANITGNEDPINFTNASSVTASTINTAGAITWTLNGTTLTEENSVTIGDGYVVSAPTKSGTKYVFEARKPKTYTVNLTYQDNTGADASSVTLTEGYKLRATGQDNTVYTASVNTDGTLANWQSINSQTLPQAVVSFQFLDAQDQPVNKLDNYSVVLPDNMNPSDGQYTIALAEPLTCTASITVDVNSVLTDGDYYIVATKGSADVGYYKIGATAENIAFTAFAGGEVSLDTETTFRVVKLATNAATDVATIAAATDVASYSGAKIGENRYTWARDDSTHKYAFSVAPDALPEDTLRQVIVNLYCHDGTTRVDDDAATSDAQEGLKDTGKKMVIVARLEDKSKTNDDPERVIGFQAVEKAFDGHGSYDGIYFKNTFTGLAYQQSWNGYDGAGQVGYDSANHDISIRMYVVDSDFYIGDPVDVGVYNNVRSQAEAPEGYAFKSAPNGNVTSGATTTLNLQKTLPTKYQVKVLFDEAIAIPGTAKVYLYVEAQHATSGTDKFAGLVTSATPVTELTYVLYDPSQNPASGWTKNNGGKFTGNENVKYGLYFLKQGTTLDVDQLNETTVSEIAEGGYVYGNTVSYTKQRTIEEIDNQTVITDYVVLTRIPTDSDYNFRSVLGNGLYFGITANELTQDNDLQTNFACNTFKHEGHSVTPNLSGASSGTFYIGEVTGSQVQINSAGNNTTCTIYVGEASKDQIMPGSNVIVMPTDKANIANIVNPILAHGKAVSDDMAAHAPTMNIVVPANANEFVLDTRMFPEDATIYIDGDYLATTGILGITDGLKIWKHENQVIVFNFKTTQSVKSSQYVINGVASSTQTSQGADGGANAGSDRLARGVVWNMNTLGGSFDAGTMLGIVLAPNNGNVDIAKEGSGSSGAGWIIANTVKNWGGEWHNIYADMPAVNKAIINARKTVNNRNAKGREKFLFKLERYNKEKEWQEVKAGVQNLGSAIEFANVDVNDAEHDCWTIYKITETAVVPSIDRAEAYTITNKVYYAAVYSEYVAAEPGKGTSGNVIYPTQYYESFDEAAYATTIGAQGYVPNKDSAPGVSRLVSDDVPVFNNLYNTDDEDGLVATKMMEGRSLTDGDVFTFTLQGEATTKTGKTISVNQTKNNDAIGKVRFDELKFALNATQQQIANGYYALAVEDFDENNEFIMTLTMAEDTSNLPESVQSMTEPKTLTVTVKRTLLEDPTANEELDVTISPKNSELKFINKYSASGNATITAKKAENADLGNKTFQFQLLKEDGTTVIETSNPVAQGQTATFTALSYQLSDLGGETYKDFTYKVKEVIPDDAEVVGDNKVKDGVTYDTTVHTVVVRMTDDGEGHLTPSYKVDDAAEFSATLSTPAFSNAYSATGSVDFKATKVFDHGTLTANQFTFKLIQVTDDGSETPVDTPIAEAQTVSNVQNGSVNFATIPFTLEHANGGTGTYYFLLKEEVPQDVDANNIKEGIKYDTSKIWVKVEVTDAGDGSLTVTKYRKNGNDWKRVTDDDDTLPDATFTNEQLGELNITKNITVNSVTDPSKTGTFWYAVYRKEDVDKATGENSTTAHPVRKNKIEVTTGGTATVTEDNLPYGEYCVFELTAENGEAITENSVPTVIGGKVYTVSGTGTTVSAAKTAGSATLTNDVPVTSITGKKTWKPFTSDQGDRKNPVSTTLTLTLTRWIVDGSGYKQDSHFNPETVTIFADANGDITRPDGDKVTKPDLDTEEGRNTYDAAWTYTWENLPLYGDSTEVRYFYKVDETFTNAMYARQGGENSGYLPDAENNTVQVFNNVEKSPVALPATGGMGTGVIYGAGAVLMLLAVLGLILLNRKRTDGEGIR